MKYDQEMEEKEAELEQLQSDYDREQKELAEVEEVWLTQNRRADLFFTRNTMRAERAT